MSTSNKPIFATYWDPMSGPSRVRVYGHGSKPGYMRVSEQRPGRVGERQVPQNTLKFEFGPDAKKFGLPYKDPYAGIDRNDDIKTEGMSLKAIARLLREAGKEDEKEEGEDSLDAQIDKYFSSYESEAKNSKNEALDFRMMTRRFLLEAGEDEEDEGEEEEEAEKDEEAEEGEEAAPDKASLEDLDMGSFVSEVMRLVDNYDSLLEVKNTILRRAANYLTKNYEAEAAEAFKEELLESHGIEIGKSKADVADEEFQAPKAAAAGPMGGST